MDVPQLACESLGGSEGFAAVLFHAVFHFRSPVTGSQ